MKITIYVQIFKTFKIFKCSKTLPPTWAVVGWILAAPDGLRAQRRDSKGNSRRPPEALRSAQEPGA